MAKKKIKVFEVIAENRLTGAPRVVLSLLAGLPKERFQLFLLCPEGDLFDAASQIDGVTVLPVPMKVRSDLQAVHRINRLIRKYDPDIVHAHGARAGILARLGAFTTKAKTIYTEHTRVPDFSLSNIVIEMMHRIGMKAADIIKTDYTVAVSESVAEYLRKAGLAGSGLRVIYNGIPPMKLVTNESQVQKEFDLKPNNIVIGTVGSLNRHKDPETLLKAFGLLAETHPSLRLMFVGEGELRHKLEQEARNMKLADRVKFTGFVDTPEDYVKAFDIFVLPSRSEAFGLVILEAMQADVPVIASQVGGITELITPGVNGLLFKAGDASQLAETIKRLLKDSKLVKELKTNAKSTLRKFTLEQMLSEHEALYEELAKMPAIKRK